MSYFSNSQKHKSQQFAKFFLKDLKTKDPKQSSNKFDPGDLNFFAVS
tara:strand:- start:294 stop:434 length:141 start_codon:yes stop_codon:yes gene_type:complete